jgi:hypothetical protein
VLPLVSTEIVASEVILAGVHYSNYLADFWYYFFKDINMFSPNIPARAGRLAKLTDCLFSIIGTSF